MRIRMLALAVALLATPAAWAWEWAAGVAMANVVYPAYRGTNDLSTLTVPLPTLALWSDNWQMGRQGASVDFGPSPRWRLRLSAGGALPADSDKAHLREGMPDLDTSLEVGPALTYIQPLTQRAELRAELITRAVFATDFSSVDAQGLTLQPRLVLLGNDRWRAARIEYKATLGPLFATREYHGYYYDVDPAYTTDTRPEYRADAGYSGTRVSFRAAYNRGRLGVYLFTAYDNLAGTPFADSPLVETHHYPVAGLLLSWRLGGTAQQPLQDD